MSKRPAQQPLPRSRSLNSLVNEQESETYKGGTRKKDTEPSAEDGSKRFKENDPGMEQKTLSFNIPRSKCVLVDQVG